MKNSFFEKLSITEDTIPVLKQLAEALPGGFFVYHAGGEQELIFFNSRMPALFGCADDEEFKALTGNSFKGIVHPDDYALCEKTIKEQISSNEDLMDHIRYRIRRKDGSIGILDDYGHFNHSDVYGDIFYVFVQDITEQTRQEEYYKNALATNYARILALEDDFESLYDVELESGRYEQFIKDMSYYDSIESKLTVQDDFFAGAMKNINLVIYPEDREGCLMIMNRDYLRKALDGEAHFDWYYRLVIDARPVWFRMRIVYKDKEKRNVIIGIFNAEKEMAERQQAEKIAQQSAFTRFFLEPYQSAYYVGLDDLSLTVYKRTAELENNYPVTTNYLDALSKYIEREVHPDDKAGLLELIQPKKMKELLARQAEFSFNYRLLKDEAEHNIRFQVIRGADVNHAAFGFKDVTEETREQQAHQRTNKLVSFFGKNFAAAFLVNLNDDSYRDIAGRDNVLKYQSGKATFGEHLKAYVDKYVYPVDKERFGKYSFSTEAVREHLLIGEADSFEYRRNFDGEYRWARVEMNRINEEEVLVGFRDCDEEATTRIVNEKLAGKYDAIYEVNLEKDEIRPIRPSRISKAGDFSKKLKYSETVKKFAETVAPKYKQDWLAFSNPAYMKEYMADEDQREYIYELPETAHSMRRFTVDVLERVNGEATMLLFSFMGIDDLRAQTILLNRQMAEQSAQLEESLAAVRREKKRFDILHDIIHSGQWSFKLNAADEFVGHDFTASLKKVINNDLQPDPGYWQTIVHPDDLDMAVAAFNAAVADHSCQTPYDVNYRMIDRDGKYNWFRSAGRVVRQEDGSGEFFGIHVNINKRMEEEQKRLLGTVKLSLDVLSKANIGLWSFELDEGKPPRMYVDDTMLGLIGLDHQVPPEETYHAWYDHIDSDSYGLVKDAVEKMSSGEHAEVQYPWHHPDGHTMVVRCGGVRNFEYTAGIRIEGTHQNVSAVLHYDEEEVARLKKAAIQLQFEQFRNEAVNEFVVDNEADPVELLKKYADRLRVLINCDQVIYRGLEETRILVNNPIMDDDWTVPIEYCRQCPHSDIYNPLYKEGYTEMNNCQLEGWRGIPVYEKCPVKSALTRIVYCDGEPAGYLAIHYIQEYHQFSDVERSILEEITRILSMSLSRYEARKENKELKLIAEMKQQLEEALSMAQAANRAKTVFLNNMSHDIRTPMNAIIGFTGLAVKHIDERERLKDYLGKIGQSSEHLLSLINDVLDMSRIESGKMSLDEKNENLDSIINNLQDIVQANMQAKQHKFRVETVNLTDKNVICDKLRLSQVLLNILSNSIKYTNAGGRISLKVTEKGKKPSGYATYEFRIQDNGMGMDKEYLKVIFDPFTRVKSSTVSGIQGTGLGMAITKNFVDMMGGSIEVESELGKGTIMTVTFDFKVAAEENKAAVAASAAEEHDFRGRKILLVEDNELNMEIATELLTEYGFIIEAADDGDVALAKIRSAEPGDYDLILMDVQMPRMDGYEATRQIRALGTEISKIPILAMTANAFEEDRRRAIEAGMNDHIAKPIDIDKLKETLARFL